jgi:dTDP-4-dehydrorhamnose reductase
MFELTNQNQGIIASCLGNGVTFGDNETVAHVSFEGQITWYSYKREIAEATKKHITRISEEYQKQAMIPLDAIIRPRDQKFMSTYLYKNPQGQYKHLADIYYPKGKGKGGFISKCGKALCHLKYWKR